MGNTASQEHQTEIAHLERSARWLNWYLISLTLASLAASAWLYASGSSRLPNADWWLLALCVGAATMGSSIAALLSAQERRANGWEVSDGTKYPGVEPKDKFNKRMVPRFYSRPILGAAVGAVFYFGAPTVFGFAAMASRDPGRLAFWCFVVGVLAKTFLETLKDLFKKLGTK